MASDNEACCESDPNFAVICGFLEKFGITCGLATIDFLDLQYMLENCQEVSQELINLHVKLLRKARKSVSSERWERAIIKFCHSFCTQDAWEIERFGYKKARLSSKLRILKELLEMQFDYNPKFKNEVNKLSAVELRTQPLGRDRLGHVYWFQTDETCQIRVYKEDPDEETWALVVKNREGLVNLITDLNDGKETVVNEDSNSLESEKPILDTGQTDSDSSKQDPVIATEENPDKQPGASIVNKNDAEEAKKVEETLNEQKESEPLKSEVTSSVVSSVKSAINLRIKPMSELLPSSNMDVNKKEITGVKEKYIRSDSSSVNFGHHRKAVDSAGFDVHANYLKRPLTEVEDVEVPSYIKRPRLDRPTLLGNKRKKSYSDEDEEDGEEDEEVSDTIEEPLMLVKGEGSGQDNKEGNTGDTSSLIDDEIEEEVMYFYGVGSGYDCETGNDNQDKQDKSEDVNKSDIISKDNQASSSESDSLTVTTKEFKLGTIIDVRTNKIHPYPVSPTKKSRWDIGKPSKSQNVTNHKGDELNTSQEPSKVKDLVTKFENINTQTKEESVEPAKRSMFFFGPGCLTFKPAISIKTDTEESKSTSSIESSNDLPKEPERQSGNSKSSDVQVSPSEIGSSVTQDDTVDSKDENNKVIEEKTDANIPNAKGHELHKESIVHESKLQTPNDLSSSSEAHSSVVHMEDKPKKQIEGGKINKEENKKTDSLSVINSKNDRVSEVTKIANPTSVVSEAKTEDKENSNQTNSNNTPCSSTLNKSSSFTSNVSAILPDILDNSCKELNTTSTNDLAQDVIEGKNEKLPSSKEELNKKADESTDTIILAENAQLSSEKEAECNLKSPNKEISTERKSGAKEVSIEEKITKAKVEMKKAKGTTFDNVHTNTSESISLSSTQKNVLVPTVEGPAMDVSIDAGNQKPREISELSSKLNEPIKKKTNISESSIQIEEIEKSKAQLTEVQSANVPKIVAVVPSIETNLQSKETTIASVEEISLESVPLDRNKEITSEATHVRDVQKSSESADLSQKEAAMSTSLDKPESLSRKIALERVSIKSVADTSDLIMEATNNTRLQMQALGKDESSKQSSTLTSEKRPRKEVVQTASNILRPTTESAKVESMSKTIILPSKESKLNKEIASNTSNKSTNKDVSDKSKILFTSDDKKEVGELSLSSKGKEITENTRQGIVQMKVSQEALDIRAIPNVPLKEGVEVLTFKSLDKEILKDGTTSKETAVKDSHINLSKEPLKDSLDDNAKVVQSVKSKSSIEIIEIKKSITVDALQDDSSKSQTVETLAEQVLEQCSTPTQKEKSIQKEISCSSKVEVKQLIETVKSKIDEVAVCPVSMVASVQKEPPKQHDSRSQCSKEIADNVPAQKEIPCSSESSKVEIKQLAETVKSKIDTVVVSSASVVANVQKELPEERASPSRSLKEVTANEPAEKEKSIQKGSPSSKTSKNDEVKQFDETVQSNIDEIYSSSVVANIQKELPKERVSRNRSSKEVTELAKKEKSVDKEIPSTSKSSKDEVKQLTEAIKSKTEEAVVRSASVVAGVHKEPLKERVSRSQSAKEVSDNEPARKEIPSSSASSKDEGKQLDETVECKLDEVCLLSMVQNVQREPPKQRVSRSQSSKVIIDNEPVQKEKSIQKEFPCSKSSKSEVKQLDETVKSKIDEVVSIQKEPPKQRVSRSQSSKEFADKTKNISVICEKMSEKDKELECKQKLTDSVNLNISKSVPLVMIERPCPNLEEAVQVETTKSTKTTDVQDENKVIEEEEEESKPVTARRSTRRTRSTTFDKPPADNKNESNNKVVKKPKKVPNKESANKVEALETSGSDKSSSTTTTVSEKNEEVEIEEQPTIGRELRSKGVKKSVPLKKSSAAIVSKAKKSITAEQSVDEKKSDNAPRVTRSKIKTVEVINVDDIEEQIIKNEIRPSKKFKMSDSMEVDSSDTPKLEEEVKKGPSKSKKSKRTDNLEKAPETKKTEAEDEKLELADEPKCVEKKVALLTCVDINKLKDQSEDEGNSDSDGLDCTNDVVSEVNDSDSSESVVLVSESDPLDVPQSKVSKSETPMTLATFKLDLDDSPISSPVRVTRKRAAQQSVDALRENITKTKQQPSEKKSGDDSKKPKLKQKRPVDHNLRRSIEEQKAQEVSSSEEEPSKTQSAVEKSKSPSKRRMSSRSNRTTESPTPSSDALSENSKPEVSVSKAKTPKRNARILLGLEISPEIESLLKDDAPIRQSRRIAQLKIKEEAERRKLEEVTLNELKEEQRKRVGKKHIDKDYKFEKRKRSKVSPTDDETTNDANESDDKKKKKHKRKHWDPTKQFDAFKAWESSSGSSSSEVEDEEEEIEEDEDHPVVLRSDHEFSPESDLEEGAEAQPLKRARTVRKESDAEEEEVDDCACQKCGQKDHPEWILLCDSCDSGWHCSCLRPALLVIPEGDWFCPPCQHATLVKRLEAQLYEYDKKMNKKEMEMRRKERLAYVGISLDNVLPSKEAESEHKHKLRHVHKPEKQDSTQEKESEQSGSEESESESESNSSYVSGSDEPVYQLRERRQAHSYRFNDYDELINSAIQEEIDAVKEAGNQGRGKDISTIVNAEIEEAEVAKPNEDENKTEVDSTVENVTSTVPVTDLEPLPPVVPVDTDLPAADADSDEDIIRPVRKNIGKKKHRKLNSLDVSSEDDADSDEDFKGSSSSESEEAEDYSVSSSSEGLDTRRGKRRKDFGPIRRSTRARISRYDKDFINDSESAEDAPSRKKPKSIWDESESEESDGSWGGKSKRKAKRSQRRRPPPSDKPKKLKKKRRLKREGDDSDPEVFKRKPNIKFGGLNDDEDMGRRTRGKKINYLEALGTDSEDELRRKPPKIEESEEEYIVHEDEDFKHQIANEKDSDDSGPDPVLQDIAKLPHPKPKPRGRGKAGLKIPRKPKEPSADLFSTTPTNMFGPAPNEMFPQTSELFPPVPSDGYPPPVFQTGHPDIFSTAPPDVFPPPSGFPMSLNQQPSMMETNVALQRPNFLSRPMLENPDQESRDLEDEPNPIEQINKNVEQMNEQEMEKMMEEEDYANKQLQLVALQIEKEKKRREKEAIRFQQLRQLNQVEPKIPKKRGRKPKNQVLESSPNLSSPFNNSSLLMNSVMANNAELSEPPGISLPLFSEISTLNIDGTPRKRRGRGKGKKTLAAEAAAAAKDGSELEPGLDCQSSSNSNTISPAPDSPMHSKLGIAAPPQPFSQSQPTPSVITRMLQSQSTPGAFPSKYFTGSPGDPTTSYHAGAPGGPRGPIPSGYPLYVRGGPAPIGIPPGLPPIYHRSTDPSPSGGSAINVSTANRDRNSPSVVSPASGSPLSKGDPTPPPPPYTRPQVGHFPSAPPSSTSSAPRHVPMIPPPSHLQHRTSGGTMPSPYHPNVPPNYHFGTYPPSHPQPPIGSEEGQPPTTYPNAAFPEPYLGDNGVPGQPSENNSGKGFEDDTGGEFVGLVSYFSSQREDDLDT